MAFASGDSGKGDQPMADINMVPMIDVMLVLLIIFIVAAPLLTHQVKIELPQVSTTPAPPAKDPIQIAIQDTGEVFWNGEAVQAADLVQRFHANPQAEIHFNVSKKTAYEKLADVMGMAAREGITKIAFVTDPSPKE